LSGNVIEMNNIVKRYGKMIANDHINFSLKSGEIHALLGENGAGKTTLMHILYGMTEPEEGQILVHGKPVRFKSSSDAIALKIGLVSQHFSLISILSVSENIVLRDIPKKFGIMVDKVKVRNEALRIAEELDFEINPDEKVEDLSVGEQQIVEIMKALHQGSDILILDEPTALLTPQENEKLFAIMRAMSAQGHAVIIITHKMDEAMKCDRATVLRGGKKIATYNIPETSKAQLTEAMFGQRERSVKQEIPTIDETNVVLELKDLHVSGLKDTRTLKGINFRLHAGEILGIAGIAGNGQTELVESLTGFRKISGGEILLNGQSIANMKPEDLRKLKVAYIPEKRMQRGIFGESTISNNLLLGNEKKSPFSSRGILNLKHLQNFSEDVVNDYGVKTTGIEVMIRTLSGGNIQKVILAREFASVPELIIAHEPMRGLDLKTIDFIQEKLMEQKAKGKSVLFISTDYEEVLNIADRIGIMFNGQLLIIPKEEADLNTIGRYIVGDWAN
jgi:ABC-type uncharacterized transport system ATPase subunit